MTAGSWKVFVRAAGAALAAWHLSRPAEAADLRVSPPQASLDVAVGAPATFSFQLVSSTSAVVRPGTADFDLDPGGELVRRAAGSRSCASLVRANPEEVVLRAGEPRAVRVSVDLPREARGTFWCFVTFELKPAGRASEAKGTVVLLAPRVSVPVFVTAGETRSRVTARFGVPLRKDGAVLATLTFLNPGPSAVKLAGEVLLEEPGEGTPVEVGNLSVPRFVLLPEHERSVPLRLPAAGGEPLRLRGLFDADGGAEKRVTTERPVP